MVEALEVIGHRTHFGKHGDNYGDWDSDTQSEAQQLLASITRFDVEVVIFLLVYFHLSILVGITVKLQGNTMDIIAAHQMTSEITAVYARERADVDAGFKPTGCQVG